MKKPLLLALALLVAVSGMTLASGSSGGSGVPSVQDPYTVTETTKFVIDQIRQDGSIVVRPTAGGQSLRLVFNKKTEFSAEDKSAFGGRSKLKANDLKVGHKLKVVTRQSNGEVLRVKILRG